MKLSGRKVIISTSAVPVRVVISSHRKLGLLTTCTNVSVSSISEQVHARPVVLELKNVTVYEGQNATLLCKAFSYYMPHFVWLRSPRSANGSQIQHPHHINEIIKQNEQSDNQHLVVPPKQGMFHGGKLTLINVTKNDEGKYTCIVGNALGYAVEQAYIFVRDWLGKKMKVNA